MLPGNHCLSVMHLDAYMLPLRNGLAIFNPQCAIVMALRKAVTITCQTLLAVKPETVPRA